MLPVTARPGAFVAATGAGAELGEPLATELVGSALEAPSRADDVRFPYRRRHDARDSMEVQPISRPLCLSRGLLGISQTDLARCSTRWPGGSVLAAEQVGHLSGQAVSGRAPKADGYDDRASATA